MELETALDDWQEGALAPGVLARLMEDLFPDALRRLPSALADFVGRGPEAARLGELLRAPDGESGRVAVLSGEPGAGKTELALLLAHLLTPSYPDLQLFWNLQPGGHPADSGTVMVSAIRRLRPGVQLPPTDSGLVSLYRHTLEGRRGILLLDAAADAAQVEALAAAPAGWLVLITARRTLDLEGALRWEVGGLSRAAARRYLERGLEPALTEPELADLEPWLAAWDRLPLSLSLARGYLQAVGESVSEGVRGRRAEGLAKAATAEALLPRLLAVVDAEHPDLAAGWKVLTLLPAAFDPPIAARLWRRPLAETEDGLGRLCRWGLLRPDADSPIFHLHPALEDAARRAGLVPGATEQQEIRRRWAGDLLASARRIHQLYLAEGDERRRALELFERIWPHLEATWHWMADQDAPEARRFLSDFPQAMPYLLLDVFLPPHRQAQMLERSLAAAEALEDPRATAVHLANLGSAYQRRKMKLQALEAYDKALELIRESGDQRAEISLLDNLGDLLREPEELPRAEALHRRQIELSRRLEDPHWEARGLGSLANTCWRMERPAEAAELYERSLALLRRLGDRRAEGGALGNLGLCRAALDDHAAAVGYYRQALAIARETDDGHGEWNWLDVLGESHAALGNLAEAAEWYREAVDCARRIGREGSEMVSQWNLARVYEHQGDLTAALPLMEEVVEFERSVGHRDADKDAAHLQQVQGAAARGTLANERETR